MNILGVTGIASTAGANDLLCDAPALCPTVGNVCDDGNGGNDPDPKFAGFQVYGNATCEPLFVMQDDTGTDRAWKTVQGTDDINPDSVQDGKINHANRGAGTFPAFEDCENLTYGGFTDWYLPALDEMNILWQNRVAIGNFGTNSFWTSTEIDINDAWYLDFGNADAFSIGGKDNSGGVRCVRRD